MAATARVHTSLLAGRHGHWLVTATSAAAVLSLLTGLYLWWPGIRKFFRGFAVRAKRGAYILTEAKNGNPDLILIASGSEIHIAVDAAQELKENGVAVRVVSMPSWEVFDDQPEDYKNQVLPSNIKARIAIEAGSTQGWHRYVGEKSHVVGIDHFGASAPSKILFEKFGITVDRVVEEALRLIKDS